MRNGIVSAVAIIMMASLAKGQEWRIDKYVLAKQNENRSVLKLELRRGELHAAVAREISSPLTSVRSAFIFQNKAIILGGAGNADIVVLYDLSSKNSQPTWFYCYQPVAIASRWIAFVEYSPNHSTAISTDVVLLYDLANPVEPFKGDRYPQRVGTPIFPTSNAKQGSYKNTVEKESDAVSILGPPLVPLPDLRLAFIAVSQESSGKQIAQLVVADVNEGHEGRILAIQRLPAELGGAEVPANKYLEATGIEALPNGAYRVNLPKWDFGVSEVTLAPGS